MFRGACATHGAILRSEVARPEHAWARNVAHKADPRTGAISILLHRRPDIVSAVGAVRVVERCVITVLLFLCRWSLPLLAVVCGLSDGVKAGARGMGSEWRGNILPPPRFQTVRKPGDIVNSPMRSGVRLSTRCKLEF